MTKQHIDTTGWEFFDVFDTQPVPGMFVNPEGPRNLSVIVAGKERIVLALNWFHAEFRAYTEAAEEAGGDLRRCELCGAHLRYAALFEGPGNTLHVVGQECCKRVQAGVENREEWALVQAMKDAKEITTKNGPRWKVDFHEPQGFRATNYADRPKFVSTWTPKIPIGRGRFNFGKPRVTVWAASQSELLENVRTFRNWMREHNVNLAQRITRRPGY